jgi:hypothetical protein
MNQFSASPAMIVSAQKPTAAQDRLRGKPLVLARSIWAALVLFTLGLLAINLPRIPDLLAQFQALCSNAQCTTGFLSPDALHTLHGLGVTGSAFAIFYFAIYDTIPLVVWVAAGLFLAWRKSDDWMALLVSLFLILFQVSVTLEGFISSSLGSGTSTQTTPVWFVLFYYFCQSLAFPVLALFPNGRFVPRWMLWPTIALMVGNSLDGFIPSNSPLGLVGFPLLLALFSCLAGAMIYRYRCGATLPERQQIKWLAFFIVLDLILNWIGPVVLSLLFPQAFVPHSLLDVLYQLVWPLTVLGIPISIGIAILRYRLWDIDSIINKALVYGLLSGILGALYAGLIIGLESLAGSITRQSSANPLVLVISTLAIAALIQPLRRRIQWIIDRRFYRRKYDAARTLAAFSTLLRNEVDLATLSEHLVAVVQETMQPTSVSLWVRPPIPAGTHQAPWRATPAGHAEQEARGEER